MTCPPKISPDEIVDSGLKERGLYIDGNSAWSYAYVVSKIGFHRGYSSTGGFMAAGCISRLDSRSQYHHSQFPPAGVGI